MKSDLRLFVIYRFDNKKLRRPQYEKVFGEVWIRIKSMQIISLIQGLWVALIIVMAFAKLRTGICIYVAYMILVPYININLGIDLQWNVVHILMLLGFFVSFHKRGVKIMSLKPFLPFVFLFMAQL